MANSDKNILITPNRGQVALPTVAYTGADNTPTTLSINNDGTLTWSNGGFGDLFHINANGNVIVGNAALNTTATNGFLYLPAAAGTPTGVPTGITGRAPIVIDSTNNTLYFYANGAWRAGGGGAISDGDKGDITVSGSGATWTIDNGVVSYAKIQNISATDKLLGRAAVGAGSIEEIACTAAGRALLDDADATAQRTTLGLGSFATLSGLTGPITANSSGVTAIGAQTGTGSTFVMSNGPTISGTVTMSGGTLTLTNATSNFLMFPAANAAAPSFTTRSVGTRIVLWPSVGASNVDYALGIEGSTMWLSVPSTANVFKWYGGTSSAMTLTGAGVLSTTSLSLSASSGTGFVMSGGGSMAIGTATATHRLTVRAANATDPGITAMGSGSTNHRTYIGYDSTNGRGFIRAVNEGTAHQPLIINEFGGNVIIGGVNVGIGNTSITTWGATEATFQFNGGAQTIYSSGGQFGFNNNIYWNGSAWIYKGTGFATMLQIAASGAFAFYTAPSGTAGTTATVTSRLTIGNTGVISIPGSIDFGNSATISQVGSFMALSGGTNLAFLMNGNILPNNGSGGVDNTYSVGSSNPHRYQSFWAVNTTIQNSDARQKHLVEDSALGLDFINLLRPVSYKWIDGGGKVVGYDHEKKQPIIVRHPGRRRHWGFLAQEVKAAIDATGVEDFAGWILANKDDPDSDQHLGYGEFIGPMVKAIQELSTKVKELEARLNQQGV